MELTGIGNCATVTPRRFDRDLIILMAATIWVLGGILAVLIVRGGAR